MYRLAVYGKGGIGKSTIAANLSHLLSLDGHSVLHVGCDPKHDSTRLLMDGRAVRTFCEDMGSDPVAEGLDGVLCVECGGPGPGRGCAGKGLQMLFSRIRGVEADYRVSDVLGDVVCGGFSVPARPSECDGVLIVTSGEMMSLLAANLILRGLGNMGGRVIGLVLNRRGVEDEERIVRRFADRVGLPIVADMPRSAAFAEAEALGIPVASCRPDSDAAEALRRLCRFVEGRPAVFRPSPLPDEHIGDIATGMVSEPPSAGCCRPRPRFDSVDRGRNLVFRDGYVMPACTSHGAVDAAMRVLDLAVILHGPANCAYLSEYAFRRRVYNGASERSGPVPEPGIFTPRLDAAAVFSDDDDGVLEAAEEAVAHGYRHIVLVPTCATAVTGKDLHALAREVSRRHGCNAFAVDPDRPLLGGKFGCLSGLFDALIARMGPCETERGTVNLVSRTFYGTGKDANAEAIGRLLEPLGLRVRSRFLDFCSMSDIEGFRAAEFDIQLGRSRANSRICDRISEVTGRRRALALDVPTGPSECERWVRAVAEYAGVGRDRCDEAVETVWREYGSGVEPLRRVLDGRRAVVYCVMARDIRWQLEAMRGMGMEISAVVFADGFVVDRNRDAPEYPGENVVEGADIGTLTGLIDDDVDVVVTNDPDRVGRLGLRWAPLGPRHFGVAGAVEWMRTLADSVRTTTACWEEGLRWSPTAFSVPSSPRSLSA